MRAGKKSKLEVNHEILSCNDSFDAQTASTRKKKKRDTYLDNVRTLEESVLSRTCRICLTREGEMKSIYLFDNRVDVQFANKITACTNVKITLGDGLPEQVCIPCIKAVNNAYSLKEMCEESNLLLCRLFKKNPLIEMTENTDYDKIIEYDTQQISSQTTESDTHQNISMDGSNNNTESILKNRLTNGAGITKNSLNIQQNVSVINNYNFNEKLMQQNNTTEAYITADGIQQNVCNNYALICYNNPILPSDYQTTEFPNNNSHLYNSPNANKNSLILVKPPEGNVPWNIPNLSLNNYALSYYNMLRQNGLQEPQELKKSSQLYNRINTAQNKANTVAGTETIEDQTPVNVILNPFRESSIQHFNNNLVQNISDIITKTETDIQQDCSNEKFVETDITSFLKSEIEIKEEPIRFDPPVVQRSIIQSISQTLSTIPSQSKPLRSNLSKKTNNVSSTSKTFSGEYLLSTRKCLDTIKKKSLQDEEDSAALYACDICGKKLSNPIAVRNHITWTHTIN